MDKLAKHNSRGYEIADEGLELYRKTWKKDMRGVRECLAEVIDREMVNLLMSKRPNKDKGRGCADIRLDWFFLDNFLTLKQDKPNSKGVRLQKRRVTFNYNKEPFTVTFERGDKLNGQ